MTPSIQNEINKLNEFLRNELTAVETYSQCIQKNSDGADGAIALTLGELQQSHASRAAKLRERIRALGGKPVESTGVWGGFAKLMEGGAKVISKKAALSVLEEGEDKGLSEYRNEIDSLTEPTRSFVASSLLPEQQRSHDQLRSIIG